MLLLVRHGTNLGLDSSRNGSDVEILYDFAYISCIRTYEYLSIYWIVLTYVLMGYRLELGAGGGLVGLAVARGCDLGENHPPLRITDQMEMFSLMRHNIALNGLEGKVEAMLLNW